MKPTAIGTMIRQERTRRRLTLQKLAQLCGAAGCEITSQAINDIELGRTAQPTVRVIQALSTVFERPIDDFARAIYTPQEVPA